MIAYKVDRILSRKELQGIKKEFKGYPMKPKIKKRNEFIEIKEIVIINPTLKEKALRVQFNIQYRRILKMIMELFSSDDTTNGDIKIAFSEIERVKRILKDIYHKEVSLKEYTNYLDKINFLEEQLKNKIIEQQRIEKMFFQNYMYEGETEEKRRGR